jgi:hypothetical protein
MHSVAHGLVWLWALAARLRADLGRGPGGQPA